MFVSPENANINTIDSVGCTYGGYSAPPSPIFPFDGWYALRVRSNFERVTRMHLRERGCQEFFPTYTVRTRWSDRVKTIEKPLFPGYIFCNFDPRLRLRVITTPGVLYIVGVGKQPVPLNPREIEAVWKMLASGLPVRPCPFWGIGQRVLIAHGALAGVEGTVTQLRGACRLVVSIPLLQRSIATEIEREWVRPLN